MTENDACLAVNDFSAVSVSVQSISMSTAKSNVRHVVRWNL